MWVQCCFVPVLQGTSISVPIGWVLSTELLVFNINLEVCLKITDFKKMVTCSEHDIATSLRVIHSVFNYYTIQCTIATIEWTKQKYYQNLDWIRLSLFAFYHRTAHIPLHTLPFSTSMSRLIPMRSLRKLPPVCRIQSERWLLTYFLQEHRARAK